MAIVVPFNIDEGVVGGEFDTTPFHYVHSHVSAVNFMLFVIVRTLFVCPQTRFAFENILVHEKIVNKMYKKI